MRFTQFLNLIVAIFCLMGLCLTAPIDTTIEYVNIFLVFLNLFMAFGGIEFIFNIFHKEEREEEREEVKSDNFFDNIEEE